MYYVSKANRDRLKSRLKNPLKQIALHVSHYSNMRKTTFSFADLKPRQTTDIR